LLAILDSLQIAITGLTKNISLFGRNPTGLACGLPLYLKLQLDLKLEPGRCNLRGLD